MKKIYGAVTLDDAEYAKEEFREKWDKKYPNILKSWDKKWSELTVFFEYPQEIKWTMPVRDWGLAYAQFSIYFDDRFAA